MAGHGVWVVTGASRGIGAAIARLAVEAGQKVALIARSESVMELAHSLGESAACLLYTSPSPRDATLSRMPSSA